MKTKFIISIIINSLLVGFIANSYMLIEQFSQSIYAIAFLFVAVILFAGAIIPYIKSKQLAFCQHGTVLLCAFYFSIVVSTVYQIILAFKTVPHDHMTFVWSLAVCIAVNFIVFWVGIICVYLTSTQLGAKWRIIGIICGLIPIANLVALFNIIKITTNEYFFEAEKYKINKQRKTAQICATKYPILLVHGVF